MKVLFDHNVNRRFRPHLPGHEIRTAREMNWDQLTNGVLLKTAAEAGYEAFITVDKKLEHEQNLAALPIPVIVIDSISTALPALMPFAPAVLKLLEAPLDRTLYLVQADGQVMRLSAPRS